MATNLKPPRTWGTVNCYQSIMDLTSHENLGIGGFFPFACPIDKSIEILCNKSYNWSPKEIIEKYNNISKETFIPKMYTLKDPVNRPLVAVINLCNSVKFYSANEFRDQGIPVFWSPMGHGGKGPTFWVKEKFNKLFQNYVTFVRLILYIGKIIPKGIIGVHCVHGLNRTGSCIVMFLMAVLKWSYQYSRRSFEAVRGYSMTESKYFLVFFSWAESWSHALRDPLLAVAVRSALDESLIETPLCLSGCKDGTDDPDEPPEINIMRRLRKGLTFPENFIVRDLVYPTLWAYYGQLPEPRV